MAALGFAAALAALLWSAKAGALEPSRSLSQYNSRTWRRVNQLPSNLISTIAQAQDGHLWLGTPRGLIDFDGSEFKEVGLPGPDDSHSRIVTSLAVRRDGGLWVGTERGGYGTFDGSRFEPLPGAALGGDSPTVRFVQELRDGSLIIGTLGTVGRRTPGGKEETFSADLDATCAHEDASGRIWLGTSGNGLFYWEKGMLTQVGGEAAKLWAGQIISAVAVDQDGIIWVGAANGLHSLNSDLTPRPSIGFPGQAATLFIDSHGVLWIGGMFDGLYRYTNGVLSSFKRLDGLASDHVLALAETIDGSIWIGTEDGLTQLSEAKFPIFSTSEGLSSEAGLAVAADPRGGVWVGTNNGLNRIKDGEPIRTYGFNRRDGFTSEWIRRIWVARNGDLYLMGGRQDLSRFRDGHIVKTWNLDHWSQAMAEDDAGLIFTHRRKLSRLVGDDIVPYRLADGREPEFGWINRLLTARDGSMWVAANPGLTQIREGKEVFTLPDSAGTDRVFFSLCEDDTGAMWASRNSGLVRIKNGKISSVGHAQGLHSDLVYAIAPDLHGNFWLDSPDGFFRVSQKELNAVADGTLTQVHCTVYDGPHVVKTTAKINSEYSICTSTDGRIWLNCAKGVIQIDPDHLPVNSHPPPIRLSRVRVDGTEFAADRDDPNLLAGASNLEFEYSAIDYQAPDRIHYRYRLEGYQDGWVDAGRRRSAYFTNLSPGSYRFQVQACNADGVWNLEGASLRLTLPPALHEHWWFRLGLGGLGLGIIGAAWALRDRDRRREIAEIRRRERLQMQMIESSPVPMLMLDAQHRVLYVNATFTHVFGFTAAELPDLGTWWRLAHADRAAGEAWAAVWEPRLQAAATAGRSLEPLETTLAHRDGSPRHIVITTSAVGERTLVICSDLTERKRAEDERRRLEEQVRQGQKLESIGRLAGGVAHDFNNLLTIILGNVSLLEMDSSLSRAIVEPTRGIKAAAKRAAHLTSQLLSFSRKQPLQATAIDLNVVVKKMTSMLQRLLGENIRMEMQLAPGVVSIRGDAAKIEQMVLNLVLNSRDAMPDGGRLTISTQVVEIAPDKVPSVLNARAGCFACITVRDTGCGIPAGIMPRIFDPFFTTKEVGKGTGLGLPSVFGSVEQHQGWIDVQSEVDRGTAFHLYLPADATIALASLPPEEKSNPPVGDSGCCILLVEDDAGVRDYARRALVMQGHRVLEAASGQLALPVWQAHQQEIEILFTDVVMPDGLNGLELGRRLQLEKPALKVIYASGYSAEVTGGDFSGRQGRDFLAKPYSPGDLAAIIRRAAAEIR